jgi:hypothetical protein
VGGIVGLAVRAPAEIALGASVQLAASLVQSDGSVEDITDQAQWSSSNSRIVTVDSGGRATGGAVRGEAEIIARYGGRSASARVIVLPAGTFRLTVRITENGQGTIGVILRVISGVGEGLVPFATASGDYIFYGVSGRVRLQAKKEGFVDRIEEIDVSAHSAHEFELVLERPVLNLAGTYTLTMMMAQCREGMGTLPDAARKRTYTASVSQDYRSLRVALTEADFILANGRGNSFVGHVEANERIIFFIGTVMVNVDYYGGSTRHCESCDLVERLTPGTALAIGGSVAATETASGISGILFGSFWLAEGTTPPLTQFTSHCTGVHDFIMQRR